VSQKNKNVMEMIKQKVTKKSIFDNQVAFERWILEVKQRKQEVQAYTAHT
jgi:hypothetical protein